MGIFILVACAFENWVNISNQAITGSTIFLGHKCKFKWLHMLKDHRFVKDVVTCPRVNGSAELSWGVFLIGQVRGGTGTHKACDIFDTLLSGNIWILTVVQNMHLRWHPLKATRFLVIKMFFFISTTQCSLVQLGAFAIQIIWNEKYIANILYMSAITHLPKIFLLLELPWWRHQMEIFSA